MKFKKLLLIFFFTGFSLFGFSQNQEKIKHDFVNTFANGKADALAVYFEGFASVQIPGHSGNFSAIKTKIYVQAFINDHPVRTFQLLKSGFSGDDYFVIGLLKSKATQWNIYFLFNQVSTHYKIQQIEIEETEE